MKIKKDSSTFKLINIVNDYLLNYHFVYLGILPIYLLEILFEMLLFLLKILLNNKLISI